MVTETTDYRRGDIMTTHDELDPGEWLQAQLSRAVDNASPTCMEDLAESLTEALLMAMDADQLVLTARPPA